MVALALKASVYLSRSHYTSKKGRNDTLSACKRPKETCTRASLVYQSYCLRITLNQQTVTYRMQNPRVSSMLLYAFKFTMYNVRTANGGGAMRSSNKWQFATLFGVTVPSLVIARDILAIAYSVFTARWHLFSSSILNAATNR